MRCGSCSFGLFSMLVVLGAVGCRSAKSGNAPPDPLLMSKTPAKARYLEVEGMVSRSEPKAPAMPAGAWLSSPPRPPAGFARLGAPEAGETAEEKGAAALAWSSKKSVEGTPVSRPARADEPAYGRAADYRWLRGVLERPTGDKWVLRYEAISRGVGGGKVCLGYHPSLDSFRPGDVVRVEGRLDSDGRRSAPGAWLPYPLYRVQGVRLVRRQP